ISTLFRVNKGILGFNSPVFSGMFLLPEASTQELYEGVLVVRVTDTTEELVALLTTLHNPGMHHARSLLHSRVDPDLPSHLTPLMRMATKYLFDHVRTRVIAILHERWPQSFEQWLRAHAELSVIQDEQKHPRNRAAQGGLVDGKAVHERMPEPCAAIRFAQDYDV
ncbi:hypothetical protein PHLGIDRAFT_45532, partial [Phlebiopsis gigantea 11061_1 CR5-6]